MTIPDNLLERPTSRAAFIELMERHGDKRIKFGDLRPGRAADEDARVFRDRYFAGQRTFTLQELVLYVDHDHRIWPTVVLAVEGRLKDDGIIDPEHRSLRFFDAPDKFISDRASAR